MSCNTALKLQYIIRTIGCGFLKIKELVRFCKLHLKRARLTLYFKVFFWFIDEQMMRT